jgi:hypothetical protein
MVAAMPNRRLTKAELLRANELLTLIRERLKELSAGDHELLFAFNRKIAKELTYDERGKPMQRKKLKKEKWEAQNGRCAECGEEMALAYSVLDRRNAVDRYTSENTRLIHADCDYKVQAGKGYA